MQEIAEAAVKIELTQFFTSYLWVGLAKDQIVFVGSSESISANSMGRGNEIYP